MDPFAPRFLLLGPSHDPAWMVSMARLVKTPTWAPSPAGSWPQAVTPRYGPLSLTAELPYAELIMALDQA
jgi:hypothetical protein